MKKVIFISAIALAAAVSCTKSEVVDTKFNEQIGFETYLGRDAQTKATPVATDDLTQVFVYGYYTGTTRWSDASEANLWSPMTLACNKGTCTVGQNDVRYWANDSDLYTFLAYAPATIENVLSVAAVDGKNPTLTYTVPSALADQKDVLYAVPQVNRTKENGTVALQMKHALARLTVKAKVNAATPFNYHVKSVVLGGNFNTTGSLVLANQETATTWTSLTKTDVDYTFYTNAAKATEAGATPLTVEGVDYAGANNYLMMIPTDCSAEGAAATLTVVYSTYAGGIESIDYTKTFPVNTNFEAGKAYAIALEFVQAQNNEIKFSVSVDDWDEDTTPQIEYPAGGKPTTEEPEDETPQE